MSEDDTPIIIKNLDILVKKYLEEKKSDVKIHWSMPQLGTASILYGSRGSGKSNCAFYLLYEYLIAFDKAETDFYVILYTKTRHQPKVKLLELKFKEHDDKRKQMVLNKCLTHYQREGFEIDEDFKMDLEDAVNDLVKPTLYIFDTEEQLDTLEGAYDLSIHKIIIFDDMILEKKFMSFV
jgi:hypothetical protein